MPNKLRRDRFALIVCVIRLPVLFFAQFAVVPEILVIRSRSAWFS
jgi:hypothetical protein